jgi:hypothetical protein
MTDTDTVRIIVISTDTTPTDDPDPKRRQHRMDTSVSTAVPLSRLAIDLATKLAADLAEERVPTRWLTNPGSALELAPISGDRWDQTKTLAELDVVDGNRIILTTRDANERYPRIIESLADQSAEIRSSHFAPWDAAASHAFAAAGMPTAVAAVSAIAAGTAVRHGGMAQWIIAAALGIVGVIVALSAVTCTQFKPKSPVTPALGLSMHAGGPVRRMGGVEPRCGGGDDHGDLGGDGDPAAPAAVGSCRRAHRVRVGACRRRRVPGVLDVARRDSGGVCLGDRHHGVPGLSRQCHARPPVRPPRSPGAP